jgi:ribosomal protein S18 acetylase RimI-like enzyme
MDVRRVQPGQWRELRDLRLLALSDAPEAFESRYEDAVKRPEQWWIDWAERSADGEGQGMFLAWDGDAPVGIVGAFVEQPRCWLISMWAAPAARRRGIGSALVESVAEFARASRHTELFLKVRFDNEPAKRLYERCGFRDFDEGVHELTMRRSL